MHEKTSIIELMYDIFEIRAKQGSRGFRLPGPATVANPFVNAASGTLRPLSGHRHTLPSMAEEWRVSLVIDDAGGISKRFRGSGPPVGFPLEQGGGDGD